MCVCWFVGVWVCECVWVWGVPLPCASPLLEALTTSIACGFPSQSGSLARVSTSSIVPTAIAAMSAWSPKEVKKEQQQDEQGSALSSHEEESEWHKRHQQGGRSNLAAGRGYDSIIVPSRSPCWSAMESPLRREEEALQDDKLDRPSKLAAGRGYDTIIVPSRSPDWSAMDEEMDMQDDQQGRRSLAADRGRDTNDPIIVPSRSPERSSRASRSDRSRSPVALKPFRLPGKSL